MRASGPTYDMEGRNIHYTGHIWAEECDWLSAREKGLFTRAWMEHGPVSGTAWIAPGAGRPTVNRTDLSFYRSKYTK